MTASIVLGAIVVALVPVATVLGRNLRSAWWRSGCAFAGLLALSFILFPLVGSTVEPRYGADLSSLPLFVEKSLVAAWWVLLTRAAAQLVKAVLRLDRALHVARLTSDLTEAAVILGSLLVVLDVAYGVSVTGLVATSGVIAIVLGLALQNTLGDLFSGIAIGLDRPFATGDAIALENGVEGKVVEVNWRSTRIKTSSSDIATIPNSILAKSRITNRSRPSSIRTDVVTIVLDNGLLPSAGAALLRDAALNVEAVSHDTLPSIACTSLSGDGATYEVTLTSPASGMGALRAELLDQVARHARYAGVGLASSTGARGELSRAVGRSALIEENALTRALTPDQRTHLSEAAVRVTGRAGDVLASQGERLASLFLIAKGVLEVTWRSGGAERKIGKLGPGDFIGEVALLADRPWGASVTALSAFVAYRIDNAMLSPLLKENPSLLNVLQTAAGEARETMRRASRTEEPAADPALSMQQRIQAFFGSADARGDHC